MTPEKPRLLIDASIAVMWHMPAEPCAAQARELLLDWQQDAVDLGTIDQFPSEVANAFLTGARRNRLTVGAAHAAVQALLALRFARFRTANRVVLRAWEIAARYGQRVYDCLYVAVAERKGHAFWTGDRRLYNSLQPAFSFVHWIGNYQRMRP